MRQDGSVLMGRVRRWFDPGWWGHLRYHYPERLLVAGGLLAVVLAVAGYLSVSAFGNRLASGTGLLTTTHNGRVRVLHVVRTVAQLQTRTLPGGTRVEVHRSVRYKPVYRRKVVLLNGKPVTVTKQVGSATHVRTTTVVQNRTQTVTRTETGPSRTVTVSVTVTGPGVTVTETVPTTVTVTTTCGRHHC